mmetsp:Transcript_2667/g.3704  ORF Transcript_2667/g.3704 Transcript_2667/m.3704 type:complete len:211 (-) Transcript_2667:122-754(-)
MVGFPKMNRKVRKASMTSHLSTGSSSTSGSNPLACLAEAAMAVGNADFHNCRDPTAPGSPPRDIAISTKNGIGSKHVNSGEIVSPVSLGSYEESAERQAGSGRLPSIHSRCTQQCRDDEPVAYAVSKRGLTERRADKPYSSWHTCSPPPGIVYVSTQDGSSMKPAIVSPGIKQRPKNIFADDNTFSVVSKGGKSQASYGLSRKRSRQDLA